MRSVYIHIPFCETICSYCDFCKMYYYKPWILQYLHSLEKEIEKYYQGDIVKTIYIGGGTPTSLDVKELEYLFGIIKRFCLSSNVEFTVECNIENLTEEKMNLFYQNGVNRLSIGVQTISKKNLTFLERHHTKEEVIKKVLLAKKIGFENINIDIMYGFEKETIEDVLKDLEFFLSLKVPHFSTYSLMIEPHTKIYGKVKPISEELDKKMYDVIYENLKKHGYIQYETSNFSKKGFESKHNLTYWNNEEYYGFGMGASGYVDHVRYENTTSLRKYKEGLFRKEEHSLSEEETLENEFILGLRKTEGINKKIFEEKYHRSLKSIKVINYLIEKKYLEENDTNLFIPRKYRYVANEILVYFINMEV